MDRTVREHISDLEQRFLKLNEEMMRRQSTLIERNRLASEIRAVELALSYYRAALHLEQRLAKEV
jgi:hypothetical protein